MRVEGDLLHVEAGLGIIFIGRAAELAKLLLYGIANPGGVFDSGGSPGGPYDLDKLDLDGGVFGAHLGYNWQFNRIVLGVEASLTGGALKDRVLGSGGTPAPYVDSRLDLMASVRGRAGYAFDNLLVYGTAGLGYAKYKLSSDFSAINLPEDHIEESRVGGVFGGGVEYGINHWTIGAEILHYAIKPRHRFTLAEIPDADAGDHVNWNGTTTLNFRISYKF